MRSFGSKGETPSGMLLSMESFLGPDVRTPRLPLLNHRQRITLLLHTQSYIHLPPHLHSPLLMRDIFPPLPFHRVLIPPHLRPRMPRHHLSHLPPQPLPTLPRHLPPQPLAILPRHLPPQPLPTLPRHHRSLLLSHSRSNLLHLTCKHIVSMLDNSPTRSQILLIISKAHTRSTHLLGRMWQQELQGFLLMSSLRVRMMGLQKGGKWWWVTNQ